MAVPFLDPSFVTGEIAPALFGRVELDKARVAATTMRNCFVSYRGGADSRAGTAFVGFSKQTGRTVSPRMITFQFSVNQGLGLEFGHYYMRVVLDGGFVTENPVAVAGVTNAKPAVMTFGAQGAASGTPNDGAVTFSYVPGELVTLAGGTALTHAVVAVTNTQLVSILANGLGSGYAVNDTITLAGGTSTSSAIVRVASIQAVAATGFITFSSNPSDGDTITLNGVVWTFKTTPTTSTQTGIQLTLAGTMAQLVSDLNASANVNISTATYSTNGTVLSIVYDTPGVGGNGYTLAASVAVRSGATLTGGATNGVGTVTVSTPGIFTANPAGGLMTEASTSGGGSGASFQTAVFGPHAITVSNPGAYTAVPANPVAQAFSDGIGQGATFTMVWAAVPAFSNGDWIAISGISGMTELNSNTYVVAGATPTTVQLLDVYGNQVDSSAFGAYTGGGTASRIYTLPTIYDEQDLLYLKITQSADVMSICCVNTETGTEYPPQDLSRLSDINWVFSPVIAAPSVSAPASISATISAPTAIIYQPTYYQYVVTAVSPDDGTESTASPVASVNGVSISVQQGQVTLNWSQVPLVNEYNIYKAVPTYAKDVPAGALFGYAGSVYGTSFGDTNIVPELAQVPPLHRDPFARGQVIGVRIVSGGSGYSQSTASVTINTGTGSGAIVQLVVQGGAIAAAIIKDSGKGYIPGDTVTINGGSGATATLQLGAQTGTYPSVPSYFQERRVYANTLNNPDTYFMSQPGAFKNFDIRIPTIATDAITGSPWAVEVNGIQFMVQTAGGLLVMTGQSAWLLVGAGTFATNVQPISPSSQVATAQPFTGCSPIIQPIKINYDVLYVTSKGSFYYDLPYQLYVLSEPVDLTQYSTHLFIPYTVLSHAWCETPYKVLWSVRSDGGMNSLTYLKEQQLAGWARHDTNGLFCSVCSVTEPPVSALYLAVQRFPGNNTAYMIERMNNRIWSTVEDAWCVDAGLTLPQPEPNATLSVDLPNGLGAISGVTGLVGGTGYSSATVATIIDQATDANGNPRGSGATATLTIVAGVITAVIIGAAGAGYINPVLEIADPAGSAGGSGAGARLTLDTTATFTASAAVFSGANVGSVIRMGGGIATITSYVSNSVVRASVTTPISALLPNSGGRAQPQPSGSWSMTNPITKVQGLGHLAGATVTGLADGNVITPRVVAANGSITLDAAASSITVGLGFTAQIQSVYAEPGGNPTVQGQRGKIAAVTARVETSRGLQMGSNQPDGSTLSPPQIAPQWSGMDNVPDLVAPPYNSNTAPLYTGDVRIPVTGGFTKTKQAAIQQIYPLPMSLLAFVPEMLEGDTPSNTAPPRQQQGGR